jgi:2-polyprenyl-3-methyl-5-hydroxy-6-metoxy-1,4-benzoquinol methylase
MAKRAFVAKSYDHYYGSGLYDARYPRPNPPTYQCALRLASTASRILDFGAGSGRYTLPLLDSTDSFLCAYDISDDACKRLKAHATAAGVDSQRLLVTSDLDVARAAGPYDLALSLFGVLSHIEEPEDRMKILNSICSLLAPGGQFLVTVPNAFRRFPLHASQANHDSESRGIRSCQAAMAPLLSLAAPGYLSSSYRECAAAVSLLPVLPSGTSHRAFCCRVCSRDLRIGQYLA